MIERKRRLVAALILLISFCTGVIYEGLKPPLPNTPQSSPSSQVITSSNPSGSAEEALASLVVAGRAPRTNYSRTQFGQGWRKLPGCDMRNYILKQDLTSVVTRSATDCTVVSGILQDPYTDTTINFTRGSNTSDDVQIDHIVALSDAWQKGATQLTSTDREDFANDRLNLLAVDGPSNEKKSDGDAATWLPPNKNYRCRYVARQIGVKAKYRLWVTKAEYDAMARVLQKCPGQALPIVDQQS